MLIFQIIWWWSNKHIFETLNITTTSLDDIQEINISNLSRFLNICKQTYEILFKELQGFSKTCKCCTKENAIRSDEKLTICKRLLSDVAKPIDGMLDMILDRLSFEISNYFDEDLLIEVDKCEIILEENKFEFEKNLNEIKRANNSTIKRFNKLDFNPLNSKYCPYTGKTFDKGEYDHILPQSKGLFNSKANLIYASSEGNAKKGNQDYTFEMLNIEHLKDVFKKTSVDEIKQQISKDLEKINIVEFKNFEELKLNQQLAFRYALFLKGTKEFEKAYELLKKDKLKTITNGTQKRLARLIVEKLSKKFENYPLNFSSKTINNQLVSATRNILANTNEELRKKEIQDSHSHCIDAMVVFYLANSKLKGRKDRQKNYASEIEPIYDFESFYLDESIINTINKNKTFINSTFKESSSVPLFQGTLYQENYYKVSKKDNSFSFLKKKLKNENIISLIKYSILYKNINGKKYFFKNIEELKNDEDYNIDVKSLSFLIYKLFKDKNGKELKKLTFLDDMRYNTTRKEIINIFFDEKKTSLLKFENIKDIPPFSRNLFKAIHKILSNASIFKINEDGKTNLDESILNECLKKTYDSKQDESTKEKRKRGKKRHKFSLPCLGQNAKYRINRNGTWQVVAGENIATKNYIINGEIKPIPYFTKNTIPLKIKDLIECLLIDSNILSTFNIKVKDLEEISYYCNSLTYYLTEASRCTIEISFINSSFKDINLCNITTLNGANDREFNNLIKLYIDNKECILNKYIGSIRDGEKAKAQLVDKNKDFTVIRFKSAMNKDKKQIILEN